MRLERDSGLGCQGMRGGGCGDIVRWMRDGGWFVLRVMPRPRNGCQGHSMFTGPERLLERENLTSLLLYKNHSFKQ